MAAKKTATSEEIQIEPLKTETIKFWLVGKSPLVLNALANKGPNPGIQGLLAPRKKSKSELAQNVKHDPRAEFRRAPHTLSDPKAPTLLAIPATAVKGALKSAGVLYPSASKAMLGRIIWVEGDFLPVFGIPLLFMAVVRNSDVARTPDVRTRVAIREWATPVTIRFLAKMLTGTALVNLAATAGSCIGVGDGRHEKGCLDFGMFDVVDEATFLKDHGHLLKLGRVEQERAMDEAAPFDEFSSDTMEWLDGEMARRGIKIA